MAPALIHFQDTYVLIFNGITRHSSCNCIEFSKQMTGHASSIRAYCYYYDISSYDKLALHDTLLDFASAFWAFRQFRRYSLFLLTSPLILPRMIAFYALDFGYIYKRRGCALALSHFILHNFSHFLSFNGQRAILAFGRFRKFLRLTATCQKLKDFGRLSIYYWFAVLSFVMGRIDMLMPLRL